MEKLFSTFQKPIFFILNRIYKQKEIFFEIEKSLVKYFNMNFKWNEIERTFHTMYLCIMRHQMM